MDGEVRPQPLYWERVQRYWVEVWRRLSRVEGGRSLMMRVLGGRCGSRREEWKASICSNSRPKVRGRAVAAAAGEREVVVGAEGDIGVMLVG